MSRHRRKRAARIRHAKRVDVFVRRLMPKASQIQREIVMGELTGGRRVVITDGLYDPIMTFMLRRDEGTL
jgi:hypothetical protein